MKKLVFNSQILENTDRYDADFSLPDYIYDKNGMLDREKTLDLMLHEEYGYVNTDGISVSVVCTAEDTHDVYAGKCKSHKTLLFTLSRGDQGASFPVDLFIPNTDEDCPLIVALDFDLNAQKCYCPLEEILGQNVTVARILYTDVTSDDKDFSNGIARLLSDRKDPHSAGKLAIWAYAASLVGGYMLEKGYVKEGDLYVSGHSRLGKTALLAGALDERFYCAFSNDSGCGGASLARENTGEDIKAIVDKFPYWFCQKYQSYAESEDALPFDQHYLLAANSAHRVYVASAVEDAWACPKNEYLSCVAASDYFKAQGKLGFVHPDRLPEVGECFHEGDVGYHLRAGTHYMSREDWKYYIEFLESAK